MFPHVVNIHHSAPQRQFPSPCSLQQSQDERGRTERGRKVASHCLSSVFSSRRRQPSPCRPAANAPPPYLHISFSSSPPFFHCLSLHSHQQTSLHLCLLEYLYIPSCCILICPISSITASPPHFLWSINGFCAFLHTQSRPFTLSGPRLLRHSLLPLPP